MILSDKDIREYIKKKRIVVKPLPDLKKQLGAASLDLRLGDQFLIFRHSKRAFIDLADPHFADHMTEEVKISQKEPYVLQPGEFVLGKVLEWVELPDDLSARIDGRSSLGRLGLVIHSTAGHIDPGFRGNLTLEMSNIGMMPILLYPKLRVCQLVFEKLSSPAEVPYYKKKGAKYLGSKKPEISRLEKEIKDKNET